MIDRGRFPRCIALLCAAAASGWSGGEALAEPWLAVRSGLQCSACHVNYTGGGKRTQFGSDYGLERLPGFRAAVPGGEAPFNGTVSSRFSVGGDFRGVNTSRFAASDDTNGFATREANLYADLELLKERLRVYADVRLAPGGAATREIVALVENLPGRIYVKAGRFFAPFGLRLLDDEAFVRARTGYTFAAPDDGVEIGWQPGDFSGSLAITNGNGGAADDNTNKRVSAVTTWAHPRYRVGSSAAVNHQGDVSSVLGGIHAGVKLGDRVVALGEADLGREEENAAGSSRRRAILFGEVDLLVGRGVSLKAAADYEDPDRSQSGDEVNRLSLGAEWFAIEYVQVRIVWRRTDRPPEVRGTLFEDDREIVVEAHLFL